MNIHPFVVHFPVAFLSVYCLAELVRFRFIASKAYWFYIKATLAIIGGAGAVAAYLSGKLAGELVGKSPLIELHSKFGKASAILFGIIAALYAIAWLTRLDIVNRIEGSMNLKNLPAYSWLKKLVNYFVDSFLMVPPALVGLACIVITGALGGAIVFGPDVDPFVRIIYDLVVRF